VENARRLFSKLTSWLAESKREAVFLILFSPSMSLFAPINRVYEEFFPIVRPPGRAFVADHTLQYLRVHLVSIPTELQTSQPYFKQDLHPAVRRAVLHVQSQSYWAAGSIGPYAQANRVQYVDPSQRTDVDHIFVSGRIGMVPKTQALCTWLDLFSSSTPASSDADSGDVVSIKTFFAEFSFMMANSLVAFEHYRRLPVHEAVTHATFFIRDAKHAAWIAPCWDLYWTLLLGENKQATAAKLVFSDTDTPSTSRVTLARVIQVDEMPKNASVEVILEGRRVTCADEDD